MIPHTKPEFEISLDDEEAEPLLDEAATGIDADDLPVLTDVVDDLDDLDDLDAPDGLDAYDEARVEPFIGEATPIILEPISPELSVAASPAPFAAARPVDLAERLVALDTAIARHIEDWVANELPQLVSRELDELAERLGNAAAAHLRATLLPLVANEIASTLDDES